MYLSKSAMNCYLMCPKKFQFQYIDKIRSPTTPQMERGLNVHEFAETFFDNITFIDDTYTINPDFLDMWNTKCDGEAIEQINNFINFEYQHWEICKSIDPKNPKKLFIPLLREGKYTSEELQQITIIDRLDLRPDGNYTLVEYKTEKFKPKGWKDTEFRRELMFQKTTLESSPEFKAKFKGQIVDFVVYFPRSNDIMNETFNYRTAIALKKALEKMRYDISCEHYPCAVQYFCRFCYFNLDYCDMSMEAKVRVKC